MIDIFKEMLEDSTPREIAEAFAGAFMVFGLIAITYILMVVMFG